ncbi:sigma-54-dependent transcriptional regulator (plasmid) [Pseudoalteromonas sp. T1lg65]|uniref:sigma-54-dependent transcriptional regulator n=1 Tax=Pseudoalteromonas sp. T1lg65 TaxID=2077101 RepID=UPI003F799193
MDKILIVDDNPAVVDALSLLLELHDYQVVTASNQLEAIKIVSFQRIALVIQDMNFSADTTSGDEGIKLFHQLKEINANLPIILITAWTELESAVQLVKAGAADYLAKPWDDQKLLVTVANLIELGRTKQENSQHRKLAEQRAQFNQQANLQGLVYKSAAMQRIVDMALQVAKSDVSVLITGPNGSGKEKIAEIIQSNSPLSNAPFVKVNAGALPSDLIEGELFGAESGAYTGATKQRIGRFEAAHGGTLFLDEIGNLPLSGQTKLLRVLQSGEFERLGSVETRKVKVRVISATNADLPKDIADGKFREDLYYRLNVIELNLPPLAQRREDILPLVMHFLPGRIVSFEAEKKLTEYPWPGNVRELENACKRAAVMNPNGELQSEDFGLLNLSTQLDQSSVTINEPSKSDIEQAMREFEGVVAKVARHFNMSRQALYRRMKKFDIEY